MSNVAYTDTHSDITFGLESIEPLEGSTQWFQWNQDIMDHLRLTGYGELLSGGPEAQIPVPEIALTAEARNAGAAAEANGQGPLDVARATVKGVAAETTRLERWSSRQLIARAAIKNRLQFNPRTDIEDPRFYAVALILQELEERYRAMGSITFQRLDSKFNELTLANCTSVSDFSEQLGKTRLEILALDSTCTISNPKYVNKFLQGLGPAYSTFLLGFYLNHSLLPKWDAIKKITQPAVTFEQAVIAAKREEESQRVEDRRMATAAMSARKGTEQGTVLEQPRVRCTRCRKPFHTVDKCWHLHPELKEEWEKHNARRVNKLKRRNQQVSALAPTSRTGRGEVP